jgi:predicted phosphodiesterase
MKTPVPKNHRSFRLTAPILTLLLATAAHADKVEAKQSLFFASDIHDNATHLGELIVSAKEVQPIDFYGLVGDYGPGHTTESDHAAVVNAVSSRAGGAPYVLAEGNHDARHRFYSDPTGEVDPSRLGNAATFDVYIVNFTDFKTKDVAGDLEAYLATYSRNKVLFILCHYPPHSTRGDVSAERALRLFQVINKASEDRRLDMVVLWGHNHRNVQYDQGVNYMVMPGGKVSEPNASTVIPGIDGTTFHFAYVNAGYLLPVTDSLGRPVPADAPLHATVVTVTDGEVLFDRYAYPMTRQNDVEVYDPKNIVIEARASFARKSPARRLGDVNGDGQVNILDALLTARYAAHLIPPVFFVDSADVNLDGVVNINDALLLARYSAGAITTLPPPVGYATPVLEGELTLQQATQAIQEAMLP